MDSKVMAKKEALQELIKMMQGMMVKSGMECEMEGAEDEDEAGGMKEVIAQAENEAKGQMSSEDEEFEEYKKAEMKKGSKLPMKGKAVAVIAKMGGKGPMPSKPAGPSKMKRYG